MFLQTVFKNLSVHFRPDAPDRMEMPPFAVRASPSDEKEYICRMMKFQADTGTVKAGRTGTLIRAAAACIAAIFMSASPEMQAQSRSEGKLTPQQHQENLMEYMVEGRIRYMSGNSLPQGYTAGCRGRKAGTGENTTVWSTISARSIRMPKSHGISCKRRTAPSPRTISDAGNGKDTSTPSRKNCSTPSRSR